MCSCLEPAYLDSNNSTSVRPTRTDHDQTGDTRTDGRQVTPSRSQHACVPHSRKPTPYGVMSLAACRLQARFFAAAIEARRQAAQRAPRAGSGTVSWPPRWNCRALSFEKMCVGVGGSHFHVVEQQEVQRGRSGGADRRAGARRARRTRGSCRRQEGQHEGHNRVSHRQMKGCWPFGGVQTLVKSAERRVSL